MSHKEGANRWMRDTATSSPRKISSELNANTISLVSFHLHEALRVCREQKDERCSPADIVSAEALLEALKTKENKRETGDYITLAKKPDLQERIDRSKRAVISIRVIDANTLADVLRKWKIGQEPHEITELLYSFSGRFSYPTVDNILSILSDNGIEVSAIFAPDVGHIRHKGVNPSVWTLLEDSFEVESYVNKRKAPCVYLICVGHEPRPKYAKPYLSVRVYEGRDYESDGDEESEEESEKLTSELVKSNMTFRSAKRLDELLHRVPFVFSKPWSVRTGDLVVVSKHHLWTPAQNEAIERCVKNCLTGDLLVNIKRAWQHRGSVKYAARLQPQLVQVVIDFARVVEKFAYKNESESSTEIFKTLYAPPQKLATFQNRLETSFTSLIARLYFNSLLTPEGNPTEVLNKLVQEVGVLYPRMDKGTVRRNLHNQHSRGNRWMKFINDLEAERDGHGLPPCFGFGALILFDFDGASKNRLYDQNFYNSLPIDAVPDIFRSLWNQIDNFKSILPVLENIALSLLGFEVPAEHPTDCLLFHLSEEEIFARAEQRQNVAQLFKPRDEIA